MRRQVSVVSQNTYLFSASVRENLLLARPDAAPGEIERAARRACIHDFIASLPQGYDTWIGEQGVRLSAGERQRLAIARALLRDAPLLVLDEATANLDTLLERQVLESIREPLAGRATLLLTHRLVGLEFSPRDPGAGARPPGRARLARRPAFRGGSLPAHVGPAEPGPLGFGIELRN